MNMDLFFLPVFFKGLDQLFAVQVLHGLPGALLFLVSFPLQQILHLHVIKQMCQLDLKFSNYLTSIQLDMSMGISSVNENKTYENVMLSETLRQSEQSILVLEFITTGCDQ